MKKITLLLTLAIFILSFVLPVTAAVDLKSTQQKKATLDSRISKINSDKKKAQEEKARLEGEKKNITSVQTAENKEYNQLLGELDQYTVSLKEFDRSIADAEEDYNRQNELFKKRLKVLYENSNVSVLQMLIESKSLVELVERMQYISLIAKNDTQVLEEIQQAKQDVEYKRKLKENAKQELASKVNVKEERLSSLKTSRAELEQRLQRSKEQLEKLEKQEDDLIAESKRLESEIKNLTKKGGKYTGGSMVWPVPGYYSISSPFGLRKHPVLRKYKMHTGVDISGPKGVSVVAANNGTVILSKYDPNGYGNYLVVDHGGGITTLYAHNSKLIAEVGQKVKAGEVIAKLGATGLVTGPNMHFEVRKDGVPVNPLNGYISK